MITLEQLLKTITDQKIYLTNDYLNDCVFIGYADELTDTFNDILDYSEIDFMDLTVDSIRAIDTDEVEIHVYDYDLGTI